ncbi:sugar transferase [Acidobacteria bacterium AH-259-A15]|nr:sugar transferase [Acidobacteria bacterium AH-259-A15]
MNQTFQSYPERLYAWLTHSSIPLRLPERKFLFTFVDLIGLNTGVFLAILVSYQLDLTRSEYVVSLTDELFQVRGGGSPLIWLVLATAIWLPISAAFGVYDAQVTSDVKYSIIRVGKAVLTTVTLFVLIPYATPFMTSRSVLFTIFLTSLLVTLAGRTICIIVLGRPRFHRRTLIVGAGWAGKTLLQALLGVRKPFYQIVGFVDDDPKKIGQPVDWTSKAESTSGHEELSAELPFVLGNRHDIKDLIEEQRISTLVLSITHQVDGQLIQVMMDCLEQGVEIIPMPILYEQITGRVPIEHVGGSWYLAMPISHRGTSRLYGLAKRLMDIVLSSLGLLFLLPLTPFIALAIYINSPGPIFYRQERLGKAGRRFRVWKFRTMPTHAEKSGAVWAQKNDSRVTRVGELLRKTHIDEFPQFINILKGDMSVIGPRPERPEFVEDLEKMIPFYRTRLAVKPGMAGWGLVRQGYGSSAQDALIKLQYDLYYIKHQSIFLDIVIVLKTVIDMLTLRGR